VAAVEQGLLPADYELLGSMVQNISFNNAARYFPMQLD
jgi:glucuronate isomerase